MGYLLDTGVRQYDEELSTVIPGPRMRSPESSRKTPPYGGNERKGCLLDTGVRQYDEELSTVIPGPR